jgi:hypothetical protein
VLFFWLARLNLPGFLRIEPWLRQTRDSNAKSLCFEDVLLKRMEMTAPNFSIPDVPSRNATLPE